jgi:hypothetical protein
MDWAGLEQVAPDLAGRVRGAIERFGFVLVGTIRRDGTPRICPVEAHVVRHHLMLVMIAESHKARDLARDSRLTLQTPVTNPDQPEGEAKLCGHVTEVDQTQRAATAALIEEERGWRPRDSWCFYALDLSAASCIEWHEDHMTLSRWDQVNGLRPTEERRLDMEASAYVPVR